MKKKYLKMVGYALLGVGMVISINLSVRQKTNWSRLMKENVEALTSPEIENSYYPCVKAMGFCFIHGVEKNGIAIID